MSGFPKGWEHYNQRTGRFRHECKMCGAKFETVHRTGVLYCSAKCRKRSSNGHKTWNAYRICKRCQRVFGVAQPHQRADYCSGACRQAAYRERKKQALQPVHTNDRGKSEIAVTGECEHKWGYLPREGQVCLYCGIPDPIPF